MSYALLLYMMAFGTVVAVAGIFTTVLHNCAFPKKQRILFISIFWICLLLLALVTASARVGMPQDVLKAQWYCKEYYCPQVTDDNVKFCGAWDAWECYHEYDECNTLGNCEREYNFEDIP